MKWQPVGRSLLSWEMIWLNHRNWLLKELYIWQDTKIWTGIPIALAPSIVLIALIGGIFWMEKHHHDVLEKERNQHAHFYLTGLHNCWLHYFFFEEDYPWANIRHQSSSFLLRKIDPELTSMPIFLCFICGTPATAWLDKWCVSLNLGSELVNPRLPKPVHELNCHATWPACWLHFYRLPVA